MDVERKRKRNSPKKKPPVPTMRSLEDALREKYCSSKNDMQIGNGLQHCVIVFQGRPKSGDSRAELGYLRNVVLTESHITRACLPGTDLSALCPNVVDLDLSGNLLGTWQEIMPMLSQLKQLKFVNLARNAIKNSEKFLQSWNSLLPSIENLVLNSTGIEWDDVLCLTKLIPQLKELHICNNEYTEVPDGNYTGLESLECLRMNENRIKRWTEIWKLRKLDNLKSLILSGNPLHDVFFIENDSQHEESNIRNNCGVENKGDENGNNFTDGCQEFLDNVMNEAVNLLNNAQYTEGGGDHCVIKSLSQGEDHSDESQISKGRNCDNSVQKGNKTKAGSGPEGICTEIVDDIIHHLPVDSDHMIDGGQSDSGRTYPSTSSEDSMEDDHSGITSHIFTENTTDDNGSTISPQNTRNSVSQMETEESPRRGDNSFQKSHSCDKSMTFEEVQCSCPTSEGNADPRVPFKALHNLCLSETWIRDWTHLKALSSFPSLKSLRIKDIDLAHELKSEERRKLFLASLPNIKVLNGSEVTPTEREKAERHYLRYFCDHNSKPQRYYELEQKHGTLQPIVEIDLRRGFQEWALLHFVFCGKRVFSDKVRVVEPVGRLRLHIASRLCLHASVRNLKMYHKACGPHHHFEDYEEPAFDLLNLDSLPMSRFDIMEGDEIHIDVYDHFETGSMKFLYLKSFLPKKMFINGDANLSALP